MGTTLLVSEKRTCAIQGTKMKEMYVIGGDYESLISRRRGMEPMKPPKAKCTVREINVQQSVRELGI